MPTFVTSRSKPIDVAIAAQRRTRHLNSSASLDAPPRPPRPSEADPDLVSARPDRAGVRAG